MRPAHRAKLTRHFGIRSFSRVLISVLMLATIAVPVAPALANRPVQDPITNPDLDKACGLNILMILDESTSIATSHAQDEVRDAFKAFTGALKNTSSSMAVAKFGTTADLPSIGGFPAGEYVTVTDTTKVALDNWVDTGYNPVRNPTHYTNWDDGLRMGNYGFAPRPTHAVPHLTVFITDGDPNRAIRDSVSQARYENDLLNSGDMYSPNKDDAADKAVANANGLKHQQSHILAIAVGDGISGSGALNRLKKISGPDVYSGGGGFDISTDDIYRVPNFDELEDALREAAFQLCSPSVTVQKLIDLTPDPDSLDDAIPGFGWTIQGAVTAPAPGGYDWVLPVAEAPATGPKSTLTDGAGFATFQWLTDVVGPSGFTATETIQPGFENDQAHTACTFRTPDLSDRPLTITVGDGTFSGEIPTEAIVTCTFVNIADPSPSITIEKKTDGQDADTPTGPTIPAGDTVAWTYEVTNTGNTVLNDVAITDAEVLPAAATGPTISCPETTLVQGQSMTCTATGVSGRTEAGTDFTGQYGNLATVNAVDSHGSPVQDSDPSHYVAAAPGIKVEKSTNGEDADTAPGPFLAPGAAVTWDYTITNTGSFDLTGVTLDDDQLGAIDMNTCTWPGAVGELAIDESATCQATGTAVAEQYQNIATATGTPPEGSNVSDQDPSHYFGVAIVLDLEKATNGQDADAATGPIVEVGSPVHWTYVVTNNGNIPISSWTVEDSVVLPAAGSGPSVACPRIVLVPGASATCSANGIAQAGQYGNIATASTVSPLDGATITATDPSHYFGAQPSLTLEKSTNGQDADSPTGPYIPIGGNVSWSYVVTNAGNVQLTGLVVIDSDIGDITASCGTTTLDPANSTICSGNGSAVAGQYQNLALALAYDPFQTVVGSIDPSHYFGADPGIHLEKHTNGVDADSAPGPYIPIGDPIEWSYIVTNTGNTPIENIVLVDDIEGTITCPSDSLSESDGQPGGPDEMTCTITGIAAHVQYENLATVTGDDVELQQPVSDTDPSHYFGYVSEIVVEKSTNGVDADTAPGPYVPVGDPVTWTYVVTNPGDLDIQHVVLVDDQGVMPVYQSGDAGDDGILSPGEVWTYEATGTATAGQYENLATVEGFDELENFVQDTDPSHYFGAEPLIDIEKSTNGEDADAAPGPYVTPGDAITWTYVVTNTGNVDINDVAVTDSRGVIVTCAADTLAVGASTTCIGTGVAAAGQYDNVGSVTGTPPEGLSPVTDTDPSHYFGIEASIDIQKTPDVTYLQSGSDHEFTIAVTNTSNVTLTDVVITDPLVPACDADSTTEPGLASMAPDAVVTYACTVSNVTTVIDNVADVDGVAPNSVHVTDIDNALVAPWNVGGTGSIGDTVWRDTNENGIQDSGEVGVPNAVVRVFYLDGTETQADYTTDANGWYLAVGLVEGNYRVEIDTSTINAPLTTPGSFTFYLLGGEERLDADFGINETLPVTGADIDRQFGFAMTLILIGAILLIATRRRGQLPFAG